MDELKRCPFCGGEFEIGICDDEGNRRDFDYTLDPWSGIGYQLIHTVKHVPEGKFCPIATHKEEIIGALIYDSVEEVMEYCNNRADGWIPVSGNDLPKGSNPKLYYAVTNSDAVSAVTADVVRLMAHSGHITHWMTLPASPKGV